MSNTKQCAVLFADLRGSTALYFKLGNSEAATVVTHSLAMLGQIVARNGGRSDGASTWISSPLRRRSEGLAGLPSMRTLCSEMSCCTRATIAAEMGEVVVGGGHYAVLFFIGIELFLFTFVLNSLAALIVTRLVRRMSGATA